MAISDEKNEQVAGDETIAMPPDRAADPDATVAAAAGGPDDPDATRLADSDDPDATRLADEAPTRAVAPDDLPTIVVPHAADGGGAAAPSDGLDAMDDPYYAAPTPDDLTSARAPVSIPSPVQSLPERRRRLPRWAAALLVLVLLAAAGFGAYCTYEQELWGGKTVPNVVGMTQEDATRTLEELGFAVSVDAVASDENLGQVLGCDPVPGTRADPSEGATISVASERVIPRVVGLSEEAAREALISAGAQSIQVDSQGSSQPAGTVLSVSPEEGQPFVSGEQVTLVVARAFTVPDVLGMSLQDAQATLSEGGFSSSVTYVESTDAPDTVTDTSPSVGSEVAEGATIELMVVATYPDEPADLLAYFDISPQALASYLEDEGFSLKYGEIYASGGNAHAAYEGPDGELLQISNYPETGQYAEGSQTDVLSRGAGVGGIRYAFSRETLPEGGDSLSEAGIRAIMDACGLENLLDTCTQDDIVMPQEEKVPADEGDKDDKDGGSDEERVPEADKDDEAEAEPETPRFICGCGRQGSYTWAVVIGGYEGRTSVVAIVAPTEHFDAIDLSKHDGNLCDYIAYVDLYAE